MQELQNGMVTKLASFSISEAFNECGGMLVVIGPILSFMEVSGLRDVGSLLKM